MRFMKRVLIFCFVEMIAFTAFCCGYQCFTGNEISEPLIQWHFTVFGIELAASAFMKIAEIKEFKIKKKKEKQDDEPSKTEGDETDE